MRKATKRQGGALAARQLTRHTADGRDPTPCERKATSGWNQHRKVSESIGYRRLECPPSALTAWPSISHRRALSQRTARLTHAPPSAGSDWGEPGDAQDGPHHGNANDDGIEGNGGERGERKLLQEAAEPEARQRDERDEVYIEEEVEPVE